MKTIWKLFVGDIRRITSNVVSIIIVIGLVVIPGIFTWFNVAASWDPFANTGNLKFAVANEDDGYRSDLIPVKINIGDQVVNTLRSNDQLDWTFTTKKRSHQRHQIRQILRSCGDSKELQHPYDDVLRIRWQPRRNRLLQQ